MKRLVTVMMGLVLAGLVGPVAAGPWFTEDFERCDLGWGSGSYQPLKDVGWYWANVSGGLEIRPPSDIPGNPTGGSRAFRLRKRDSVALAVADTSHSSSQEQVSTWFALQDYDVSYQSVLSWGEAQPGQGYDWANIKPYQAAGVDLMIPGQGQSDWWPYIDVRDGDGVSGGFGSHRLQAVGGGDFSIARGVWYQVVVDFDVPGNTYALTLYDAVGTALAQSSGYNHGRFKNWNGSTGDPMSHVNGFASDGGYGNDPRIYIDDIAFTTIPEPATIGLVAMGGVVLLRRRKA